MFSLLSPFYTAWDHSHHFSGWVFPHQVNLPGNALKIHPEVCFYGDLEPSQIDNDGSPSRLLLLLNCILIPGMFPNAEAEGSGRKSTETRSDVTLGDILIGLTALCCASSSERCPSPCTILQETLAARSIHTQFYALEAPVPGFLSQGTSTGRKS